jgi:transposase
MEEVRASVLELLIGECYVQLENYFLDGTKAEAKANRNTWEWVRSTRR